MAGYPVLWSFRRCPYAMRARLALHSAGVRVELREILLRKKPQAFLATSPTATVPSLKLEDRVIDESLDIMIWALKQRDPQGLMVFPEEGWGLIEENDGPFKQALDHTKYAVRYPDIDADEERRKAAAFIHGLDTRISDEGWVFGNQPTLVDFAILPFVRQFAFVDRQWFDAQTWHVVNDWLDRFLHGSAFGAIMGKHEPWNEGDAPVWFGH